MSLDHQRLGALLLPTTIITTTVDNRLPYLISSPTVSSKQTLTFLLLCTAGILIVSITDFSFSARTNSYRNNNNKTVNQLHCILINQLLTVLTYCLVMLSNSRIFFFQQNSTILLKICFYSQRKKTLTRENDVGT